MSIEQKQDRVVSVGPMAISDEALDCIMEVAGMSIGYWASKATIDREAKTYTVWEQDPQDDEGTGKYVIPFAKIHETFWKLASGEIQTGSMASEYIKNAVIDGAQEGRGDIDAGHIDGDAADVIIQLAAFGEEVYG